MKSLFKSVFCLLPVCLIALPLMFLPASSARAIEVENLYQGRVIVDSRSDERERQAAFADALREVLVKVSGSADILRQGSIPQALGRAQDYVDSWSYNSRQGVEGASLIELRVSFARSSVERLLADNNIPMWPSNRPLTLVWVVAETELGVRRVLGQEETAPVLVALREQARQRGMPLLLPLMDIDDNRALDVERLWNLDPEHIRTLSLRYAVDSILVVRVFSSLGDEYLGRSKYLFRNQVLERELYADSLQDLVQPAVDQAADELAGYYAVLLSGNEEGVPVSMQVDGISNLRSYAALMDYVEGLTDVSGFSINRIVDDRVELELTTGGQIRQLVESIALGRRLEAVSDPVRDGDALSMHYRWAE